MVDTEVGQGVTPVDEVGWRTETTQPTCEIAERARLRVLLDGGTAPVRRQRVTFGTAERQRGGIRETERARPWPVEVHLAAALQRPHAGCDVPARRSVPR